MPLPERVDFSGFEYQADQTFKKVRYAYIGNEKTGWEVVRKGKLHQHLGSGYRLLPNLYCGLCATDLARHHLPFPLPQITGHEVVASDNGQAVCVEINASHQALNQKNDCFYCNNNLSTHCPERLTLGIDRLPGGFAPYILAPVNSIHPLPSNLPLITGTLIEPFAAALHAVTTTPPQEKDQVAILGPKKLGMLIIVALNNWRQVNNIDFEITAVIRHPMLKNTAVKLGADKVILAANIKQNTAPFDIVYDTTGTPQGFEAALTLCQRELHVKSTHGQTVQQLDHLTTMVINEMSMQQLPSKKTVSHSPSDFLIVSSLNEVNQLFQSPIKLKPGTCIFIDNKQQKTNTLLSLKLTEGLKISTSRCGSFPKAIHLIAQSPNIAEHFSTLISDCFPLSSIEHAFEVARTNKNMLKIVINTQAKK